MNSEVTKTFEPIKKLSSQHQELHQRATELVRERGRVEAELIRVLQELQKQRIYKYFGCTSLFKYAVDILGLSESVAQYFITVARKA